MTDDNVNGFHPQPMTDVNNNVIIFTKSEHLNEYLNKDHSKFDILYER